MKQQKATYTQLYHEASRPFTYERRHDGRSIVTYTLEHWQAKGGELGAYIVRRVEMVWNAGLGEVMPKSETAAIHDFSSDEQALRWIVRHTEREFAELAGYEPQDEAEDEGDA